MKRKKILSYSGTVFLAQIICLVETDHITMSGRWLMITLVSDVMVLLLLKSKVFYQSVGCSYRDIEHVSVGGPWRCTLFSKVLFGSSLFACIRSVYLLYKTD